MEKKTFMFVNLSREMKMMMINRHFKMLKIVDIELNIRKLDENSTSSTNYKKKHFPLDQHFSRRFKTSKNTYIHI